MPVNISEVQVVSSVMPTMSYYGNFIYPDDLYSCPVPSYTSASVYDHKFTAYATTAVWDYPNLTGFNDDYNYKRTDLSGNFTPTSGNVISHFFNETNMQSWFDKMTTEECPLTGNEGVVTFDPLLSGLHSDSAKGDPERKWFAYLNCPVGGSDGIYGIGAYGRFDENGNAVYPSGIKMHTIYRYIYLRVFFDSDQNWNVRELYAAPYFIQQQQSNRGTMAQDTVLTGWTNVSSGKRFFGMDEIGQLGDFWLNPGNKNATTHAGRWMNVYRNAEITSGTTSIDWSERNSLMNYPYSRVFDKLNDGPVLRWHQSYYYPGSSDSEWKIDPDRILTLSGADSGWAIELEYFTGGNITHMLDFRNQEEFDRSFLATQIDLMQVRSDSRSGTVYGWMVFKNENFLSGIWEVGSSSGWIT